MKYVKKLGKNDYVVIEKGDFNLGDEDSFEMMALHTLQLIGMMLFTVGAIFIIVKGLIILNRFLTQLFI